MQKYGYKQRFLDKLVALGRFAQAAEILCEEGRILEAACLIDKIAEPGRLELSRSAELHLAYALLEQCDCKETALLRALSALLALSKIDEAEVRKARERLDDLRSEQRSAPVTPELLDRNPPLAENTLLESDLSFETQVKRLQGKLDQFEENFRFSRSFALQVELELSLSTPTEGQRISRLRSVLNSALEEKYPFAEGVARFELVLGKIDTVGEPLELEELLTEAHRAFCLFDDLSKVLLSASKGQSNTEMLRIEQFFGLIRNHGINCISKARKAMLHRWFDVGACVMKGGLFVVSSEKFKSALTQSLSEMIIKLLAFTWSLLTRKKNRHDTTMDVLLCSMLQLWLAETGYSRLQQKSDLRSLRLSKNIEGIFKDVSQIFKASRSIEVCESIVGTLCPAFDSISCLEEIPTITSLLTSDPAWKDELQVAQSTFLKYVQTLQREWESRSQSEKSAEDLSKILLLYKRTLNEKFMKHLPQDLSAKGSLGWHPPLLVGYNAFKNLGQAFTNRLKKHFLSEAKAMVEFLELHIPISIPLDSWFWIEYIFLEVILVLSLTSSRRYITNSFLQLLLIYPFCLV